MEYSSGDSVSERKSDFKGPSHGRHLQTTSNCPLISFVENDDLESLKVLLYECVWDRFSLDPTACFKIPGTEKEDLPAWFLHAAVFTGCPVLVDYTLVKIRQASRKRGKAPNSKRKRSLDLISDNPDFSNARIDCKFPITDTWIHRSFKLGLSPLHLACWRLDYRSIESLLAHGADPNILALEETNSHEFRNVAIVAKEGDQLDSVSASDSAETESEPASGLCPLHFIALGIRASPKTSLFAGIEENIMHNTSPPVESLVDERSGLLNQHVLQEGCQNKDAPQPSDRSTICCLMTEYISQTKCVEDKSSVIVRCVESLVAAGARPDFCPPQKVLIGANPLDTILQPPMRIFYAPSAARGNQNPVALRRQDLAQTADHVIAACEVLLRHGASVSPSFLDLYSWRPGILDCFHLYNSEQSRQLVKYCVRLGLFSIKQSFTEPSRAYEFARSFSHLEHDISYLLPGDKRNTPNVFNPMMIRRFVADVVNMEISLPLASVVLSWCPFYVLLCAKKETSAAIKSIRGRDGVMGPRTHDLNSSGLADLAQVVRELQLASLKHKCALAVLETVDFRHKSILELPLPGPLKRALINLDL
ncbi:hypothetical protein PoB_002896100 [Plakobranchus ocellatus]|uniref:SOCS box domain-containing protein n=1 Tax=Plakobranchus ocellatus TaxID=259542 RepID=A0AAV3ZTY3_9GAST|nr:hypothetical protein PoB_002896100 [Plakobranchus ocellatus]